MTLLILALAALLVAVTLLPLSGTHHWWVRMWDFPRVQIAVALAAVMVAALWLPAPLRWAVLPALAACLLLHLRRIRPFTPLARREMRFAPRSDPGRDDGSEVSLLSANVLMENEHTDRVAALIDREDPDVVLLMETDARWADALAPVLARYPTQLREPRPDYYGMILATRLPVDEARTVHLTPDGKPTAFAALRTRSGRPFHFVGLHPQPPVPGVDTDQRDAQILYAARFARRTDTPLVTMGDFNDAAWSDTARLFKHYGRYLDPRVGRGLYASFHAGSILIRCAIDQLYVSEEVAVVSFGLGPRVGSDHFPVLARVRIDPEAARALNVAPPAMTDEEHAEVEERLADYARTLAGPAPSRGAQADGPSLTGPA